MKLFVAVIILLVPFTAFAQEQLISMSAKDFDEMQLIWLSDEEGWIFTNTSDSSYSGANGFTYKKHTPHKISKTLANEQGDIDGWFKIRVLADSSFTGMPLFIYFETYGQAVDLYVDNKLIKSFGNTGKSGEAYQRVEFIESSFYIPFEFQSGKEYLFEFHYVHKSAGLLLDILKATRDLRFTFGIAGPSFEEFKNADNLRLQYSFIFSTTICCLLTLLFFMIFIQHRTEKIIKLILISSFVYSLVGLFNLPFYYFFPISYTFAILSQVVVSTSIALIHLSIVLIFSHVFTGKRPAFLWLLILLTLYLMYTIYYGGNFELETGTILVFLGFGIYYIIKGWETLKGAQWAIVIGFIISLFAIFLTFTMESLWGIPQSIFLSNVIFLSFPLSLLLYISIRFKEIIREVKQHAEKVLALNEEKRLQAVNQQIILEEQVQARTSELSQSLEQLKATQSQLIQAEKMASLGELTAGIAHEIQNPLNFVNNFSEVSNELIDEMKEEFRNGETEEGFAIADDIKQNLEKINHHGKRADAIVKGMLEHSRTSSGERVETDINALCDEYLRLSYHGLRAKDKTFNADFKTDFDPNLPKINVVAQDIGRVLLNLINNAFYTVSERSKEGNTEYQPSVEVITRKTERGIEITVRDNGNGIPEHIKDKIFQPFFTTKPTGQGTGLGLSLSYDIVKAHGGNLKVETREGEGSEFIIILPL